MAAPDSGHELTLPEVELAISKANGLLSSSTRFDPLRPGCLIYLTTLYYLRDKFLHQKDNLDKSITHLTELALLPVQQSQVVVQIFFHLARILHHRSLLYKQPEDIKSSLKYFRYLRDNFHPLDAFNIPRNQFTWRLVQALAGNLISGFGDTMQDMEEMAALCRELLTSDTSGGSGGGLRNAIIALSSAVLTIFEKGDSVRQPPGQVIEVLREATVVIPDEHIVSLALVRCLTSRFETMHVINEYEEAMAIADGIIAAHCPGDNLAPTNKLQAIKLIVELVVCRMVSYADPAYLEDAIQRVHRLLLVPSLSVQDRASIAQVLDTFKRQRFNYFGVTENSTEIPLDFSIIFPGVSSYRSLHQVGLGPGGDTQSPIAQRGNSNLWELAACIDNNEIADVEAAVERCRTSLPSPHTNRFPYMSALAFAWVLRSASQYTNKLDYLDQAITIYRNHLRNVPGVKKAYFMALFGLLSSLLLHFQISGRKEDVEEAMQLYPILANDGHAEVFYRFLISCGWARRARLNAHPSILTAYETAMSLLQETLVFSPTLQTQHFRLVETVEESKALTPRLPSDYASYLIETNRYNRAVEILERGRALLWSEMRCLRTPTDQLHAVSPALADNFTTINRQLESVMTSVAQNENTEIGEGGSQDSEGMDAFGDLFLRQRRLSEERDSLITQIRSFPGLENFLKPLSFGILNSAAAHGPVVIINQSKWRSDIVILHKDLPPSVISTPSYFHDRTDRLKDELLRVRMEKGLDSEDYDLTLASVLADLYELVGKSVIERLRQLGVPKKSRVWLCPTSAFCSLPLHAMGPIPSDDSDQVYFMDLYIPSYTPTLSALIESRKTGPQPEASDKPSLLLVAQPETLPGVWDEVDVLETVGSPLTTLASEKATPTAVVASLRDHRFVHFVCHGLLETGKPFDASFELHGGNLTLLEIVRSRLPTAKFAFLSACHTAELTEGSLANEGLHLAAAMQYCGFRSVVGTMWSMADMDGRDISKYFYKSIFSEKSGQRRLPYYERSARALQFAVKKLRKKRGITLERWVNFVHYGA